MITAADAKNILLDLRDYEKRDYVREAIDIALCAINYRLLVEKDRIIIAREKSNG
jgi:hypothetical protein